MVVSTEKEDVERRRSFNEARNPRVTIPNEAVQEINPLTGRMYETDSVGECFWKPRYVAPSFSDDELGICSKAIFRERVKLQDVYSLSQIKEDPILERKLVQYQLGGVTLDSSEKIFPKGMRSKPALITTDYLEMQKRLAEMELRQRSDSEPTIFTERDYSQFRSDLVTIAQEFDKSDLLPITVIRDAVGLNKALVSIENQRALVSYRLRYGDTGFEKKNPNYFETRFETLRSLSPCSLTRGEENFTGFEKKNPRYPEATFEILRSLSPCSLTREEEIFPKFPKRKEKNNKVPPRVPGVLTELGWLP